MGCPQLRNPQCQESTQVYSPFFSFYKMTRTLPIALIGSLLAITVTYIMVNVSFFVVLGPQKVLESKAVAAVGLLLFCSISKTFRILPKPVPRSSGLSSRLPRRLCCSELSMRRSSVPRGLSSRQPIRATCPLSCQLSTRRQALIGRPFFCR